ncbi:MAG: TSUP family transporter, partial [Vicinamibacterales bacterium]
MIFIATLIRSTLGFGEALVAVPLLALRIPVGVAAPLAVLVSIAVAGVVVVQDWRGIEIQAAAGLILAALFGLPLGILLLARTDDHVVKVLLGSLIVAFSLYSLSTDRGR